METDHKKVFIIASILQTLPSLRRLHIANNTIDFSDLGCPLLLPNPDDFRINEEVKYLHYLHDLCVEPFKNNSRLTELMLDGNDFSKVTEARFVQLLRGFKVLKKLSMRRCGLWDSVPLSVLARLVPDLETLDLSNNRLMYIPDGALDGLTSLRVLDVGHNLLRVVRQGAFDHSVRGRLTSVSFLGNPLTCSCDVLWLKEWMQACPDVFRDNVHGVDNKHQCQSEDDFRQVSV
jgi:Leucine-rich repeat (LRR) protein